jgi:hypothetical protein
MRDCAYQFDHVRHASIVCATITSIGTTKTASSARTHHVTFELARRTFDDPRPMEKHDDDEQDEEQALVTGMVVALLLTVCSHHFGEESEHEREAYNLERR